MQRDYVHSWLQADMNRLGQSLQLLLSRAKNPVYAQHTLSRCLLRFRTYAAIPASSKAARPPTTPPAHTMAWRHWQQVNTFTLQDASIAYTVNVFASPSVVPSRCRVVPKMTAKCMLKRGAPRISCRMGQPALSVSRCSHMQYPSADGVHPQVHLPDEVCCMTDLGGIHPDPWGRAGIPAMGPALPPDSVAGAGAASNGAAAAGGGAGMLGHGFKPYLSCGVSALPAVAREPQSPVLLALKVLRFDSPIKLAGRETACGRAAFSCAAGVLKSRTPEWGRLWGSHACHAKCAMPSACLCMASRPACCLPQDDL